MSYLTRLHQLCIQLLDTIKDTVTFVTCCDVLQNYWCSDYFVHPLFSFALGVLAGGDTDTLAPFTYRVTDRKPSLEFLSADGE